MKCDFDNFLFRNARKTHPDLVKLSLLEIQRAVHAALAEDVGSGDVTSLSTIPASAKFSVVMRAREPMVVAGIAIAETAFRFLSRDLKIKRCVRDGQRLKPGATILQVTGSARAILSAERVALNFVQRLSGVATLTSHYVTEVRGTGAKILDTRKTTPGLRRFEKYAVACGGGCNHRVGLFDMVLIKDNHLAALRDAKPNAVAAAVMSARKKFPNLKVEVEADTLAQVKQAVEAHADIVLLDNMNLSELRQAVKVVGTLATTEASGGVTLKTVRAIAKTGVDFISVGALTHSARAVDVGLDFLD
jgi:nicotinate-nucleotide pyrophosphorylase (carboxylating)